MINNQGATAGGGAERVEDVEDVLDDLVFLRDQLRRVVLKGFGLSDNLGEERDEGFLVEGADCLLDGRSHFFIGEWNREVGEVSSSAEVPL